MLRRNNDFPWISGIFTCLAALIGYNVANVYLSIGKGNGEGIYGEIHQHR